MKINNILDIQDACVLAVLQESGWQKDRSICISDWVTTLKAEGYFLFPMVIDVLANFGHLVIKPEVNPNGKFYSGEINFDPCWAATGERSRIEERERKMVPKLVPIGEWMGVYILLLSDKGEVFAETTGQIFLVGETFPGAIKNLIFSDKELIFV